MTWLEQALGLTVKAEEVQPEPGPWTHWEVTSRRCIRPRGRKKESSQGRPWGRNEMDMEAIQSRGETQGMTRQA